jgi:hypothetical protein
MLRRSYYSDNIPIFLKSDEDKILAGLVRNHEFALEEKQRNAWIEEIRYLKCALIELEVGRILLEYSIPRMGKRADAILIIKNLIFVLEFKIHEQLYRTSDLDQVHGYALDLKYFHEESRNARLVPILVATDASSYYNTFCMDGDGIFRPLRCNKSNLAGTIHAITAEFADGQLDSKIWENSSYKPTPTIIEAAQALYTQHNIREISRSDAGAGNMTITAGTINRIIEKTKSEKRKSLCFITGVPGAGKTLAGLNLANERHKFSEDEHAVFLSGNGPLVQVLQEALARSKMEEQAESKQKKSDALREVRAFIQNIHFFRDEALQSSNPPTEKVVIFDEAQRAWNEKQTSKFMQTKRNIINFAQSEPEFLISYMDRHQDWCVIVCLIGGGQEINTGEAGAIEWFSAIRKKFSHWSIYLPTEIFDDVYTRGNNLHDIFHGIKYEITPGLHLRSSLRSFRSENVEKLVTAIIDFKSQEASKLLIDLQHKYPIVLTRDIVKAKEWLKKMSRANERIGIVASSGAKRLKPYGIFVDLELDPKSWFLNSKNDTRSSYYLEDVATEFSIQGLELDWVCVAWDADFRFTNQDHRYYEFRGTNWQKVLDGERKQYLKNTYRVLLTRARQGMVIFVPRGDESDGTRRPSFYDEIYEFFKEIGVKEI